MVQGRSRQDGTGAGDGIEQVWRAEILDPAQPEPRDRLAALVSSGAVRRTVDTIQTQVAGLLISRCPSEKLDERPAELARRVGDHIGADPDRYGRWVFFPWSGALVHLLAPEEFRSLRSHRNCYKIEPADQQRLRRKTVGVVGLSVGRASVATMALEGVGGRFRLADFDTLELSNLNRLRCSVADLGLNKAVLAARELQEIDPYLDVEVWSEGVTEDNLDAYLDGLDLLVEECDELSIKVLLRERCRQRRVAVVMETSDRGLLDIERFDLEPERPIFHGLVGDVSAAALRGLSDQDKVPFALRVLGVGSMSPRLGASLVEIGESVTGWPQLASAVALGGGLLCDTARRMLLGTLTCSGRFYVDLEGLIAPDSAVPLTPLPTHTSAPTIEHEPTPALGPRGAGPVTQAEVRAIVGWGIRGPSGGNNQGWRFDWNGRRLRCAVDPDRVQTFLELDRTGSTLSVGAAVENMVLAAGRFGIAAEVAFQPEGPDSDAVCDLRFERDDSVAPDPLAEHMEARCTTRDRGPGRRLAPDDRAGLVAVAEAAGARLVLVDDDEGLRRMGRVVGACDRLAMQQQSVHRELMGDIRWTPTELAERRDGLDLDTFDVREFEKAAMRVVSRWPVMKVLREFDGGTALEAASRRAVSEAAAMAIVSVPGTDARAYFEGGRAVERVWLEVTARGIAMQPMTVLVALLARLVRADGAGFSQVQRERLSALRAEVDALFERPPDHADVMLFRLAYAPVEPRRSVRRRLDDVLTLTEDT